MTEIKKELAKKAETTRKESRLCIVCEAPFFSADSFNEAVVEPGNSTTGGRGLQQPYCFFIL